MTRKLEKKIMVVVLLMFIGLTLYSCVSDEPETTYFSNGFEGIIRREEVYITKIPEGRSVRIPEFLEGKQVKGLGYVFSGFFYSTEYYLETSAEEIVFSFPLKIERTAVKLVYMENLKTIKFKNYATRYYDHDYDLSISMIELSFCTNITYKVTSIYSSTDSDFEFPKTPEPIIVCKDLSVVETFIIEDETFERIPQSIIFTDFEEKPLLWGNNWSGNHNVKWGFTGVILSFFNTISDQIIIPETGYNYCWTGRGETLQIEVPNPISDNAEFIGWTREVFADYFDYEDRRLIDLKTAEFGNVDSAEFPIFYFYAVWRIK